MSHPRIEEVSDSDPEEMDIDDLPAGAIMAPANIPEPGTRQSPASSSPFQAAEVLQPQSTRMPNSTAAAAAEKERSKNWVCLYPIYFDSSRTRTEGRRVGAEDAVPNPLAREIVDAVQSIGVGLNIVFEPGKMHPKDWANPGRVRVDLKGKGGGKVKNSKLHSVRIFLVNILQWPHMATLQRCFVSIRAGRLCRPEGGVAGRFGLISHAVAQARPCSGFRKTLFLVCHQADMRFLLQNTICIDSCPPT